MIRTYAYRLYNELQSEKSSDEAVVIIQEDAGDDANKKVSFISNARWLANDADVL